MDLTNIKSRFEYHIIIPAAKACSSLMLDIAVTIFACKKWGYLDTLSGTLR